MKLIKFWLIVKQFLHVLGFSNLFFSNFKDIRLCSPGLHNYTVIQRGLTDARSLAYAAKENILFYTYLEKLSENNERTVIKAVNINKLNEPAKTLFGTSVQYNIHGIAVDWLTKKIYFTDIAIKRVEVCDYDGKNKRVLVHKGLDLPNGIAVWPQKGYMFVTDYGDFSKIERFNMDGSERKVLVKNKIKISYTISVDMKTGLIYWADTSLHKIEYMTVDGKNRQSIPISTEARAHYLIVYNSLVYWSNGKDKIFSMENNDPSTIKSSNEFLGNYTLQPYGLAFHTDIIQQQVSHSCMINNGGCSHLCLLTPTGRTCACPTGIALKEDGRTCSKGMEKFLLIARRVNMRLMSFDADRDVDIILPILNMKSAVGIDYDQKSKMVYWADVETHSINRVFLNGSGFEQVISFDVKRPDHVAIDWVARNIYWTDAETRRIEVARMDGSSRKIILSENLQAPRGIAVDPGDAKIYWSDLGNVSRIESADLDGENRVVIRDKDLIWPNSITLDYQARKLYWVDAKYKVVDSYDLSKKVFSRVYSSSHHPFGITVLGDYIYWTDWFRKVIQFKKSNKEVKMILEGNDISSVMGIKAVDINRKYGINDCYYKKSNCSHLCFHKAFQGGFCACPTRMELGNDGRTCNVPSGFLLFSVADGIRKISIDTYKDSHKLPFSNAHSASLLNIYFRDSRIYWVSGQGHSYSINHAYLNGSGFGFVAKSGLTDVSGLAIDWMAKNIYWSHDKPARIEVARLDGTFRKVLVYSEKMVSPFLLMVNPHINKMFWFHKGVGDNHLQIALWEANLDGSDQRSLLTNLEPSTSATIDYKTHIIYWISVKGNGHYSIQSYDRKTGIKSLVRENLPYSKGLIVFQDTIIFAENQKSYSIQTLPTKNSNTSKIKQLVQNLKWVHGITAFHASTQTGTNICSENNGGCDHLCFALSPTERVCSCSTHFSLDVDGRSCKEPSNFILFQDGTSLLRLLFDQTKPEASLSVSLTIPNAPMDFDVIERFLYWLDVKRKSIIRCYQDGSYYKEYSLENRVGNEPSLVQPYDFALDSFSKSIFWTDSGRHQINFMRLDIARNGTIFHERGFYPKKILLHPKVARLFWVSYNDDGIIPTKSKIVSTTYAGTELTVLQQFEHLVKIIALDYEEKHIFWIDEKMSRISSMSVEGTVIRYHEEKRLIKPVSLAVFADYVYWADQDTKFIYRTSKHNSSSHGQEFHGGVYSKLSEIIVVNLTRGTEKHPCLDKTDACSHICSLDTSIHLSTNLHRQEKKCACPLMQTLQLKDGKNCVASPNCSQSSNYFYCQVDSRCIDEKMKCDMKHDCSDGQDELACLYPKRPCVASNLINCGVGCILKNRRCNGIKDCPDGEDELHCKICEKGTFLCDGSNCLPDSVKCDGIMDCMDNVDEKYCGKTNSTTPIGIIPHSGPKTSSRMVPGLITGGVIFFVLLVFVIFVIFKIRNSKKNAASRDHDNLRAWSLAQIHHAESINSDDHAKSSVSTYISAVSQEPSFYDRNNVTGASSSSALTDFSRLPLDPPPSPVTERGFSAITEANNPFDYVLEDSRYLEADLSCSELGHDAPPPTLASTALLEDVDLYYPMLPQQQKTVNWPRKSRYHNNKHPSNHHRHNNGVVRYSVGRHTHDIDRDTLQKQWLFDSEENESGYTNNGVGADPYYLELQKQLLHFDPKQLLQFDPPPTPCTNYLSEEDDRPSSPGFSSVVHGGVNSHFAPPPSPTSQL